MNRTVFKPIGIGAAAGMLLAGFFGMRHAAVRLMFAMVLLCAASLGAAEAFRRSIGRLTSRRQVRCNGWAAAGLTAAACAALIAVAPWLTANYDFIEQVFPVYAWDAEELKWWILAAGGFALARILTAGFFAAGDRLSAVLTELLSFAAAAGSLVMFRNTPDAPRACAVASLIAAGVPALVGLLLKKESSAHPVPARTLAFLRDVPAALARGLLFPALACGVYVLSEKVPVGLAMDKLTPDGMSLPLLTGFALTELLRTDFRRDESESAPLSAWLTLGAAVAAAGLSAYVWLYPASTAPIDFTLARRWIAVKLSMTLLASAGGVMILYGAKSWRTAFTTLLLLVSAAVPSGMLILAGELADYTVKIVSSAAALCAVLAAASAFPDWADLNRRWRAARIRRRSQKHSARF